jgi:hypothetical protein
VLIRRRIAEAYERFMSRLDDWKTAELLAQDIAGDEPARGLVVKLYRDLKVKRPEEGETSSKRRAAGTRKPRLEELEADRRERERKKVRGLRKGIVRKKFL